MTRAAQSQESRSYIKEAFVMKRCKALIALLCAAALLVPMELRAAELESDAEV